MIIVCTELSQKHCALLWQGCHDYFQYHGFGGARVWNRSSMFHARRAWSAFVVFRRHPTSGVFACWIHSDQLQLRALVILKAMDIGKDGLDALRLAWEWNTQIEHMFLRRFECEILAKHERVSVSVLVRWRAWFSFRVRFAIFCTSWHATASATAFSDFPYLNASDKMSAHWQK